MVLDVPTCPGSLPARKDTSLLGFHHSGGSKIDVHSASRDQSVYVIATGGALGFAEKIAQPDAGRGRNLGLNDLGVATLERRPSIRRTNKLASFDQVSSIA
jgi:hypothetical protein